MRAIAISFLLFLTPIIAHSEDVASAVLREMNLARTAPRDYAQILAQTGNANSPSFREAINFLNRATPLPALEPSTGMDAGAQLHVVTQGPQGTIGHDGAHRSKPWDRISKFGAWKGAVGENIAYGRNSARAIVAALIVDEGVRGRGHRLNIFNRTFRVAGVAFGGHAKFRTMCVIDFAGGFESDPTALKSTTFAGL